jgi:beta-lactamase regulating signal transducer with metallopeptidase domain
MLAVPATILLWFHPLAWIARRLLNESREAACDDWVLTRGQAEPAAYSADLLTIVVNIFIRAKSPQDWRWPSPAR